MGAAALAGRVNLGLVARALAQSAPALAGAPLYAGALSTVAAATTAAVAQTTGNVVRNALGGNRRPPPDAPAAVLPGGLGVSEVRQIFEPSQRAPIEQQFVAKGVWRCNSAHDLSGGTGCNDGYAPMDRVIKPNASIALYVLPK